MKAVVNEHRLEFRAGRTMDDPTWVCTKCGRGFMATRVARTQACEPETAKESDDE